MWCVVVQVHKERFLFMPLDEVNRVGGEPVGQPPVSLFVRDEGVLERRDIAAARIGVAFLIAACGIAPLGAAHILMETFSRRIVLLNLRRLMCREPAQVAVPGLSQFLVEW